MAGQRRHGVIGTPLTFFRSMSRRGNPYDNAQAESFMGEGGLKLWRMRRSYGVDATFEDVAIGVPRFIEAYKIPASACIQAWGISSPAQFGGQPRAHPCLKTCRVSRVHPLGAHSNFWGKIKTGGGGVDTTAIETPKVQWPHPTPPYAQSPHPPCHGREPHYMGLSGQWTNNFHTPMSPTQEGLRLVSPSSINTSQHQGVATVPN